MPYDRMATGIKCPAIDQGSDQTTGNIKDRQSDRSSPGQVETNRGHRVEGIRDRKFKKQVQQRDLLADNMTSYQNIKSIMEGTREHTASITITELAVLAVIRSLERMGLIVNPSDEQCMRTILAFYNEDDDWKKVIPIDNHIRALLNAYGTELEKQQWSR